MSDSSQPPAIPQIDPSITPAWAKVLGILSIILGVMGMVGNLFSFFIAAFTKYMIDLSASLEPKQPDEAFWTNFDAVEAKWAWVNYSNGVIGLITNLMLFLGGIACLKLKRNYRPMFFCVCSIVYT